MIVCITFSSFIKGCIIIIIIIIIIIVIIIIVIIVDLFSFFSVPVPFKGDRLNLVANPKWQRNAKNNNVHIVWADSVLKVNRKDGKVFNEVPLILI